MTAIPEDKHGTAALINAAHEAAQEPPRPHMGCSLIGDPCERKLWLSFRWAVVERFDGRILRLFRRGQHEESFVLADLERIGVKFKPSAMQHRVDFGSHVSGSLDGIILSGVPEAPKAAHVLEVKTHSAKSFAALKKDGVEKSKPLHFVQMQAYMHGTGIDRALYVAVNKDNDELHVERLHYQADVATYYIERAQRIALSDRMPPPLSTDASWWECKFCAAHEFCHGSRLTKEVNCRTCCHATATADSKWTCARYDNAEIPLDAQRTGCEAHALHPDLVPWQMAEPVDEWTPVYVVGSRKVANGAPDANIYSSRELIANAGLCGDEVVAGLRAEFPGARVVG